MSFALKIVGENTSLQKNKYSQKVPFVSTSLKIWIHFLTDTVNFIVQDENYPIA